MQDGHLSEFKRAGAGFAAGITEALTIVTPFEVVKIKLQQQKGTSKELLRYKVSLGSWCITHHTTPHIEFSSFHYDYDLGNEPAFEVHGLRPNAEAKCQGQMLRPNAKAKCQGQVPMCQHKSLLSRAEVCTAPWLACVSSFLLLLLLCMCVT